MAFVTVKLSNEAHRGGVSKASKAGLDSLEEVSDEWLDLSVARSALGTVRLTSLDHAVSSSPSAPLDVPLPPDAVPKANTLGWKSLRSEMVRPLVLAAPGIAGVTPSDVAFGQSVGTILMTFFWPEAPPNADTLLVQSLSHTLSAYPTFCGRFLESCEIDINNAGVLVEFGECTATLADVLPSCPDQQMHEPLDISEFNPTDARLLTALIAERQSPVSFNIGTLADGALVVMVNFSHAVADARSIRQLMRDWTSTTRAMLAGQTPTVPEPYEYGRAWYDKLLASAPAAPSEPSEPFDADVSPPGSAWVRVPFEARPAGGPPAGTPAVVYVSQQRLAELKAEATEQLKATGDTGFISTYDALDARIRQVMARIPGRGASRPTVAAMAINLRGRLHAAGRPDVLLCQETAVGNIIRAAGGEVFDDPTTADLASLAAASRACINRTNAALADEAVWAHRVERERGLPSFLEYVPGKLDLFGPFPDFILSKWDYCADELDFGSGPAVWIQSGPSVPELGLVVPALLPGTEGGVFVNLIIRDELLAEFKKMPYPI